MIEAEMFAGEPALLPLLCDLEAQPVPEMTLHRGDDPDVVVWLLDAGGHGAGVPRRSPDVAESEVDAVVRVAAMVQDAVVEAQWSASVAPVWPGCPRHPGSHPLEPVADGDRAVWRCPRNGWPAAEVGRLPALR